MTTLDPAYCADGCGRLAETERVAYSDGHIELVCSAHARLPLDPGQTLGEHSSNPREDG